MGGTLDSLLVQAASLVEEGAALLIGGSGLREAGRGIYCDAGWAMGERGPVVSTQIAANTLEQCCSCPREYEWTTAGEAS